MLITGSEPVIFFTIIVPYIIFLHYSKKEGMVLSKSMEEGLKSTVGHRQKP